MRGNWLLLPNECIRADRIDPYSLGVTVPLMLTLV